MEISPYIGWFSETSLEEKFNGTNLPLKYFAFVYLPYYYSLHLYPSFGYRCRRGYLEDSRSLDRDPEVKMFALEDYSLCFLTRKITRSCFAGAGIT